MSRNFMNERVERVMRIGQTVRLAVTIAVVLLIGTWIGWMRTGSMPALVCGADVAVQGGTQVQTTGQPVSDADGCQLTMTAVLNGVQLTDGGEYSVRPGDKITVTAMSDVAGVERIGYYFYENGETGDIVDDYTGALTITVPEREQGYELYLYVEAIADNDDGKANTVTKTGWQQYKLIYAAQE